MAICRLLRGFIFKTGPPGLIGREVLADMLGIRGDCTARAPPGVRPKLEENERERRREREKVNHYFRV
jgi:hypothetical protein